MYSGAFTESLSLVNTWLRGGLKYFEFVYYICHSRFASTDSVIESTRGQPFQSLISCAMRPSACEASPVTTRAPTCQWMRPPERFEDFKPRTDGDCHSHRPTARQSFVRELVPFHVKLSKIWTAVSEALGFNSLCKAVVGKTLRVVIR